MVVLRIDWVLFRVVVLPVSLVLMSPVVWLEFDAMRVMMLIEVLRAVLPVILQRVVVAEMMVTLRLDIVVLTVFLSSEVSVVVKMRNMILQIPVTLLKMSIGMTKRTMGQLFHVKIIKRVVEFEWSELMRSWKAKSLIGALTTLLLLLWLLLLLLLLGLLLLGLLLLSLLATEHSWSSLSLSWALRLALEVIVEAKLSSERRIVLSAVLRMLMVSRVQLTVISSHRAESGDLVGVSFALKRTVMSTQGDILVLGSSGLSLHRFNCRAHHMMLTVELLKVVWLHLEHKLAVVDVALLGAEGRAIRIKGGVVRLMPSVGVEGVEFISPVEFEALSRNIIGVRLNIVILYIPRHILIVKIGAPRLKGWRPEVHHHRLRPGSELDRGVIAANTTNDLVINGPLDEIRSPSHLVDVPVILRVEIVTVVVALVLGLSITVDHIHGERILLHRGYNLDIKLIPASWIEVRTVPVGEERGNCTFLVWRLHTSDEFTIGELLKACNCARLVSISLGHSKGCYERDNVFH